MPNSGTCNRLNSGSAFKDNTPQFYEEEYQHPSDKAEDISNLISAWGNGPGQNGKMDFDAIFSLTQRVKNSSKLKGITKLLERYKVNKIFSHITFNISHSAASCKDSVFRMKNQKQM